MYLLILNELKLFVMQLLALSELLKHALWTGLANMILCVPYLLHYLVTAKIVRVVQDALSRRFECTLAL